MFDTLVDYLTINLFILLIFNSVAGIVSGTPLGKEPRKWAFILPLLIIPLGIMTWTEPSVFMSLLFLILWACICLFYEFKLSRFVIWSPLTIIGALLCTSGFVLYQIQQENQLQTQFPLVSIRDRLSYENSQLKESDNAESSEKKKTNHLNDDTRKRLEKFEYEMSKMTGPRRRALKHLHSTTTYRFISSPAFGRRRMSFVLRPEYLAETEIAEPIPIPFKSTGFQKTSTMNQTSIFPANDTSGSWSTHFNSIASFANMDSFGFVQDLDHVAGFLAHDFEGMPTLKQEDETNWSLSKLQLVSLLKHEKPQVYLSENLPRMEELQDASTRDLNLFETSALDKLIEGEDLLVNEQPIRIQMFGSLRAAKQCLQCHQVDRGTLLGAFSYEFVKDRE